ncbi:conserved hypothetical protein [Ricinus communis]|uniref:Uncharacterized protein n=1 Tax=Ricinus communis TaxID=3988 RepID=B9RX09_RICCO|nr:conserved hypothetical protein [Ricinus communis]
MGSTDVWSSNTDCHVLEGMLLSLAGPARHAFDLEMNSLLVPSTVITLGRVMLGPKKSGSFNCVDGILTKEVRDLQNQHLHPVATLQPFQCSSSHVRVINALVLVHDANRVAHGK